jgi:hypothetical protein
LLLRVSGLEHADAWVCPELAPEERDAGISLDLGRGSITAGDIRPDQQFLGILVERVGGDKPARKFHRAGTVTRRYLCARGLPEHAFVDVSHFQVIWRPVLVVDNRSHRRPPLKLPSIR